MGPRTRGLDHAWTTWNALAPAERERLLALFHEAFTRYPVDAFKGEARANASLFTLLANFLDVRGWDFPVLTNDLRREFVRLIENDEDLRSQVRLMKDTPDSVDPAVLRKVLREDRNAIYLRVAEAAKKGFTNFHLWVRKRDPALWQRIRVLIPITVPWMRNGAAALSAAACVVVALALSRQGVAPRQDHPSSETVPTGTEVSGVGPTDRPAGGTGPARTHDAETIASACAKRSEGFERGECLLGAAAGLRDDYRAARTLYERALAAPAFEARADAVLGEAGIPSILSLSQSIHARFEPGRVPTNVGVVWRSPDRLRSIPARFVAATQRLQALEALASLHLRHGRYAEARQAYAAYEEAKGAQDSWQGTSGGLDVDCWVCLAIARREGATPGPEGCLDMVPNGPVTLGLVQYEYGRALERSGRTADALLYYANAVWQRDVVQPSERTERARLLAASPWGDVFDLKKTDEEAMARLRILSIALAAGRHAIVQDGFMVVAIPHAADSGLRLVATFTGTGGLHCEADPAERDQLPQDAIWRVVVEVDGQAHSRSDLVQHLQNAAWVNLPPNGEPRKTTLVAHLSLTNQGKDSDDCSNIERSAEFCITPDGRLESSEACGGR